LSSIICKNDDGYFLYQKRKVLARGARWFKVKPGSIRVTDRQNALNVGKRKAVMLFYNIKRNKEVMK